ncbi:MAG: aminoglycoside phosphotransferase family protein [Rickettsiales bacterium]|jgi:serine/threonine protein kinase|nr:aminoglycoside phosphotransferase family protein [Rickettsiales bacterium]
MKDISRIAKQAGVLWMAKQPNGPMQPKGAGTYLETFLITIDGREAALKISFDTQRGMFEAAAERRLAAQRLLSPYIGNIKIPKIIGIGRNFIVEEFARGDEMSGKLLSSLPDGDITGIISDLAGFLNFTHQHTARRKKSKYPSRYGCFPDEKVLEFYSSTLGTGDFEAVRQAFEMARSDEIAADAYTVLTHGDLHSKNMLYDRASKTLSIIDFGAAGRSSRYTDICPPFAPESTALFAMRRDIIFAVADAYNDMPKERLPIYYDKDKIEILTARDALRELARISMINGRSDSRLINAGILAFIRESRRGR